MSSADDGRFEFNVGVTVMSPKSGRTAVTKWALSLAVALSLSIAGCSKSEKPSYRLFASPEMAGAALLDAGKAGNENALLDIFGPDSKKVISSGDPVQDRNAVNTFVAGYGQMHRWRTMPDGTKILLIGADNFPFPIPLKKNAKGQWFFDAAAGKDEILRRRIGRNELAVIDVCEALAQAQAEYFSEGHDGGRTRQYAMKLISDPGKQNGLYWVSPAGQPRSPLGPLAAFATADGYSVKQGSRAPFHGYYFRVLKGQGSHASGGAKDYVVDGEMTGGFAFVAYPAEYGNSGVMTFMINRDGLLVQKDLGNATARTAAAIQQYDPDASWIPVSGE